MSNKTCDLRNMIKIVVDSTYKAVILDVLPTKVVARFDSSPATNNVLVFVGSTVGYTIRGLARECGDEYFPFSSGYTQYFGGFIGGALKYLIKGIGSSTSVVENIVLGGLNNFGYELMQDANLNKNTSIFSAAILEMSEPVLSHIMFKSHETLHKDIVVSGGASLLVSISGYVHNKTYSYIDATQDTLYNHVVEYVGHNNTIHHDDL
ncbi:hypothetical protein NOVO_03285 [Rickettsiales bacterium Ac37b]|nr:hypothetical protein NOVO_03285 [Rickettsiales bacterium Ac37b]